MKYKFENNNLATYQIKELLKDFNLPMISVYTEDTYLFKDQIYLKDNNIIKWDGEKFIQISDYTFGRKIINLTKNLNINSSNYDTYTHRYLGDYLRFIRDYKGLDLMSLYNCFDYAQPSRILWTSTASDLTYLNIDTTDDRYKYYVVPIRFNKTYTIAIDAEVPYKLSCILFNNNFIDFTPITLRKKSYLKVNSSKYTKPYIYSTNFFEGGDSDYIKRCIEHEKDLFLLLTLPIQVNSTITILEGNYMNFSNIVDRQLVTKSIRNEEYDLPKTFITKSSLLAYNNHISYPFADRLVEFLLGNTIDSLDYNMDNTQRIQTYLAGENPYKIENDSYYAYKKYNGIWTNDLRKEIYDYMNTTIKRLKSNKIIKSYFKDKEIFKYNRRLIDLNMDITGYVDKDTESCLEVK